MIFFCFFFLTKELISEAEKKQQADNEPVEGLKELLVNVLLGLFAIVLFCIKTVQVSYYIKLRFIPYFKMVLISHES